MDASDALAPILHAISNGTGESSELMAAAAQHVAETFNAICAVSLISGSVANNVAVGAVRAATAREAGHVQLFGRGAPAPLDGDNLIAQAIRRGDAHIVQVTEAMLRLTFTNEADFEVARMLAAHEAMFVPLRARGRSIGCLVIARNGSHSAPLLPEDVTRASALGDRLAAALLEAKLLAELDRNVGARLSVERHHKLLMELAREFAAATGSRRALIDLVCQRFSDIVGDCCIIRFLENDELEPARSVSHRDPVKAAIMRELLSKPQRPGQGVSGAVMKVGTTMRVSALTSEALATKLGPPADTWIRTLDVCAVMAVPLISGDHTLGVITIWRHDAHPFTEDDQFLVESAASHAALALTNARLFSETQRELAERTRMEDRLKKLSQTSRELASKTSDLRDLLATAAERFVEIMGGACVIRLVEADGTRFERDGAIYHPDPDVVKHAYRVFFSTEQRAGEGISGRVLRDPKPFLVNSPSTEVMAATVSPGYVELIQRLQLTSMLAVPLSSGGRVIGAITMCGTRHYTQDDVEFICELANHTALALHNSRLIAEAHRELAERRRTEESLRQTKEQFHQAQKMEAVGRLAGGIAHDFNNLLTVIVNASSVLLEDLTQPESRQDVEDIQTAAHRAADLTRQLLAFSRQQVLEPQIIELDATVEKMRKIFSRVVGEDISIAVIHGPHLGRIKVDPGHINQVIMNLVVNARDAMPEGGTLTIETRDAVTEQGPVVMLSVTDTGIGMDEATQQRIFEPFFTTKDKSKGTGLGLSTVFGIVEQSGGTMAVHSKLGRGATFEIFFPRCDETIAAVAPVENRPLRGGETILLVEDDAQVRKVATAILQRSGYRVLTAESGPDAITQFHQRLAEVDLLLSDVVMPEMSGRELADRLGTIRPDLRVLYMSGYTDDAISHHRVLDPGVVLVAKPFTKASLLDRVRDVLSRT